MVDFSNNYLKYNQAADALVKQANERLERGATESRVYQKGAVETRGLFDEAASLQEMAGYAQAGAAFSQFVGGFIDYSMLKTQNAFKEVQADTLILQAQQRANALRSQFNDIAGQVKYSAARRGVKVDEGSVAKNLEESAINVGQDVQTMKSNTKARANALRRQVEVNRRLGKAGLFSSILGSVGQGMQAYGSFSKAGSIRNG